jgi:DNA-binding transcriptional LysR family regulator
LELSFSDRPLDLIEDGFDLAIRSGNIGDGAGLMTRTIGVQRMTV